MADPTQVDPHDHPVDPDALVELLEPGELTPGERDEIVRLEQLGQAQAGARHLFHERYPDGGLAWS